MPTLTSPKQNTELVQSIYEAFNRGDIDFIISQVSDEVRWTVSVDPIVPWAGTYKGKQGARDFFNAIVTNVETTSFVPQENIAEGDTVVTTGTYGCRVHATGKSGEMRWVFIWKISDGRVSSYEQYHEPKFADLFRA